MGLTTPIIETLAREHKYRPLAGDVLLIGRQAVYLTAQQLLDLYRDFGIDIGGVSLDTIEIDRSTTNREPAFGDLPWVSDRAVFRVLGVDRVRALDVSDYEGAEIVHDLNRPVPDHLKGIADIVIDGSTLDNTFNAAQALMNFCALLRPGGRLFAVNAFSPHNTPYALLPPITWLDYFVYNGFADCQLYVAVGKPPGRNSPTNAFYIDLDALHEQRQHMPRFASPYPMGCFAFAEKGAHSTSDKIPVQQDYRSPTDWDDFLHNLAVMRKSERPFLFRSNAPLFVEDVPSGHLYVDGEFRATWQAQSSLCPAHSSVAVIK
jgi:hypothetical protein